MISHHRKFFSQSTKFTEFVNTIHKGQELKSKDQELNQLMSQLNSKQPIDFKTRFERAARYQKGELNQEDIELLEQEERIL